ncbi:DUF2877 domain-containing protein [Nocardioides sp. T2.26MG-1]|uniref:DUF2877 domain-containing protein n=1 Tax=Nocardioides sp. T2.26MG-1 TaxID=3041166 RepID=UPI0024776E24|nr:DUF2877 domain-containing protein [Nocardioides sp. T2.26MG-1]CAI9411113.1 hypothetical protein HIDPHFAB_01471 [Nocardioides sp. T2.26MG-1]
MIPVSAPVRVGARLRAAADGPVPVVHRGRDAVYLDLDGWCLGVVGVRATAVPCALRTGADRVPGAATAEVRGGVLHLDGTPLEVGRLVDVQVPRVRAAVPTPAAPPGDVTAMVGRGDGLTPYDDDVLCGWLAVHRAAGVATDDVDAEVRRHLHRTTLLSATLLDCAMQGEVIPEFAAWLVAPDDPARAATLAAVGHTSGRGLLHGARLALDHLEGAAA